MSKLIIANWKLNPLTLEGAKKLAHDSDIEGLVICPPFPFLESVSKALKWAKLGAQDVFWEEYGAFTGEVSAAELKDLGAEFVIIGHSERRKLGETDEMVAKKVAAALKAGLTPILCIGESKADREQGKTKEVITHELKGGLSLVSGPARVVIAYEPIWAIGTGTPDAPENTVDVVRFITETLSGRGLDIQVLYGGSVTSENAESFLKHPEISGALVGGASLKGEEIKKIVEAANK